MEGLIQQQQIVDLQRFGVNSIKRFVRPFSFQSWPNELLPDELKNENPLGISRTVNGEVTKQTL